MSTKTLHVVIGPTAIGKTAFSIELAKKLNTEIVSADSRQFYKEMSIGTAVPSTQELQEVKHHFIHHKSIHDKYNVGKFEKDGIEKINSLFENNNQLILTGGSGLYIDAICNGLNFFPEIKPNTRNKLRNDYDNLGLEWLQQQVEKMDPVYYQEVDKENAQRLLRCLEVCVQTNQTYSSFKNTETKKREFEIKYFGLKMDRERLYQRINKRVDLMMENGLLKEVEGLKEFRDLNALQTVGYKEIFDFLDGNHCLERAVELIKQNSRRYAKRQITWLKKYPASWIEL
jgi:tRNA dimethylallyltransferase